MAVIPGMTVSVDIITGSKTIMQYLLKPVSGGERVYPALKAWRRPRSRPGYN